MKKGTKSLILKSVCFREYIDHIRETENARIKLHKMLNGEAEEAKPITEERLCETINTCIEIISKVFKEEFL